MSGMMGSFAVLACGGHVIGTSDWYRHSFCEGAAGFKSICNVHIASMVLLMASG